MYNIENEIQKIKQMIPYIKMSAQYSKLPEDVLLRALLGNQGRASYFGRGVSVQDYERAYGIFTYLYRTYDDLPSAYYLGRMYEKGHHVAANCRKAFECYLEASAPNNLNEEWQASFPEDEYSDLKVRMAKLLLCGKAQLTDCNADSTYTTAIACLLSAAADKNGEAVEILETSREQFEPTASSWARPTDLLNLGIIAQKIDSTIELELIRVFSVGADYIPCLLKDCIQHSEILVKNGNRDALMSYAGLLLAEDIKRYERYPDIFDHYCFSDQMKEIIRHFMSPRNLAEQFGNEILVVHSAKNVNIAMENIIKYYISISTPGDISKIRDILIKFVNICNNFVRKRHSVSDCNNPKVEEPILPNFRKTLDGNLYNPMWEASVAYIGKQPSRKFYFQGVAELFSDEWIARRVSVQRTKARGKELYFNGAVLEISCTGNCYKSYVRGSTGTVYKCNFTVGLDDSIADWHCNCPAFAKYRKACKHLVATFYAAKDMKER